MTRTADAVIGANYGDEAKGAAVDRLSRGADTLVVRHNSGAQAGHTVVADDGRRHVFHHVGSAAFRGSPTFLSRHFASNPMSLLPELEDLAKLGVVPTVLADRRGMLTTPYDMLLNQVVETARGVRRHGSTGHGFGETVERTEKGHGTTVGDLEDAGALRAALLRIRDGWVPARLAALGVRDVPAEYADLLAGDSLVDAYVSASRDFLDAVRVTDGAAPVGRARHVVFEGAQGLALDQERGAFPHVTRSFTGIRNALDVAREAGIGRLRVTYATRCYLTRHGAGPLPYESVVPPVPGFSDATNVPNPWQGTLRFAPLDADDLAGRLADDMSDARGSGVLAEASLAVSCLDQAGAEVEVRFDGRVRPVATTDLTAVLLARVGLRSGTSSFGPSASDTRLERAPRVRQSA